MGCKINQFLAKSVMNSLSVIYVLQIRKLWLTAWSEVLLEKLTGFQLVKKFAALYGTRCLVSAFARVHYLSLIWAISIQPMLPPQFLNIQFNIIFFVQVFQVGSFFWISPPKSYKHSSFLYTCYMPCPSHVIEFSTRMVFDEEWRS